MSSALCGDGSPLLVWREQPADGEGRCQVPCDGWRARSLQTQWGENIIKKIKQTNKHCQTINNKQVMVGEHDHCKHKEVKTSWEKKQNKQTKKTKDKKSNNQVMVGTHDHCKHNKVRNASNNIYNIEKQTATKIHINIMAASTTWWQVVRCINRNHDNNKQIVWNNNIIKQQQQMTNNIKIIKQQTSSTKNNIIKQQTTIRPAARATCSPLQCTSTLSSTRTSPLTTTSQSWRWQQRKSIIWCWSLP